AGPLRQLRRFPFARDDVVLPGPGRARLRIVGAAVRAAAFFARERARRDGLGDGQHGFQVSGEVPAGIEEPRAFHPGAREAFLQFADLFEPALQVVLVAEDADGILHVLLQVAVDVVRTLARGALEGREQLARGLL